jgi:hypothetical protein
MISSFGPDNPPQRISGVYHRSMGEVKLFHFHENWDDTPQCEYPPMRAMKAPPFHARPKRVSVVVSLLKDT